MLNFLRYLKIVSNPLLAVSFPAAEKEKREDEEEKDDEEEKEEEKLEESKTDRHEKCGCLEIAADSTPISTVEHDLQRENKGLHGKKK